MLKGGHSDEVGLVRLCALVKGGEHMGWSGMWYGVAGERFAQLCLALVLAPPVVSNLQLLVWSTVDSQ